MTRHYLLVSFICCFAAAGADIFVAPNGSDRWTGRLAQPNTKKTDGPLATLAAARDKARTVPAGQPRRIVVRGGKYFLSDTLVLSPQDAGLTVESAPGETPILYGGARVTGWERDGEHLWSARLPVANGKPWQFRMLVVNDRFCQPARLPDSGVFTHQTEFPVRWLGTNKGGWERKPTAEELVTLKYAPGDLGAWLDVNNAELTVYHMWDESLVRLKSVEPERRTVTFASPAGHPPGAFGVQKYVVWNVRQGMHQPGQWYLDRTAGKVVYWPSPGEDMRTAEVVAPMMESVIRLEGTKAESVRGVTLRGLIVSVADTPAEAGGFAAAKYEGAVAAAFTEECRLDGLTIYNVGGQGIKARDAKSMRVTHCEVRDTGACGIQLRGSGAEITDNHIYRVGISYPSAIGIYCGGEQLNVSHNEVHDTPYTAINCGGTGHHIDANLIHHAMTVLHDGAAIYFIFGKKITLRGNLVRDIPDTGGYGSSAYYIDELSEGCLVEGNVSVNVARPSHNHWAKGNTIRNNVFIHDGEMHITLPRSTEFTFERNVLYTKGKIAIQNPEAITRANGNVFFSGARQLEGSPTGTLIADPMLEIEGGVYRFRAGSPAAAAGIAPIDVSGAGRRGVKHE